MSISTALTSALSGLTATSRRAEVISSNVANAATPGYVRREVVLGARMVGDQGQGVAAMGLRRDQDVFLLNDRRRAGADAQGRGLVADALKRIEAAVGTPEDEASVTARLAGVEKALIAATADPASESRLAAVADAVKGLTRHMARATGVIQTQRSDADARISEQVATLNRTLLDVRQINAQILSYANSGRETAALMDQRQVLVDTVAGIVPVREVARTDGMIALYTPNGAALLEGDAVEIGFDPVGVITADMTQGSGALSGLTVNGRVVATGASGPLSGGSLGALLHLRDETAPAAQARLDALARDLVERFADPAVDPTRSAGAAGLLTDAGNPFDPANEAGLAGRLRLNMAADPDAGGSLSKLRDGLGATAPGAPGNAALLGRLQAALAAARQPVSGGFMAGARSAAALGGDVISAIATERVNADGEASYATAFAVALEKLETDSGVDTDHELQDLMQVEQAYAANARVVKVVDDMLKQLLGL